MGVIGNIAFPSSRNKGKFVSPPFTEDEFASSPAQTSIAVMGNIAFPSGRNKGNIISFTFTGDEFTRSPSVAPRLPSSNLRNVFNRPGVAGGVL